METRTHAQNLRLIFFLGLLTFLLTISSSTPKEVWRADHRASVEEVVYSPVGGKLATTGGSDVCIWDEKNGRELFRLTHPAPTRRVRFSPKANRILTVCFTSGEGLGESRLWDAGGHLLAILTSAMDDATFAEFDPRGKRLVTLAVEWKGRGAHELRFWDLQGRQISSPHRGDGFVISPPTFSPDGRYLIYQQFGNELCVFDAQSGRAVAQVPSGRVLLTASFSPDSRWLAVAAPGGGINLVRTSDWTTVGKLEESVVYTLAYSPGGLLALETIDQGGLRRCQIWNPSKGTPVCDPVTLHTEGVPTRLTFNQDGRMVLSVISLNDGRKSLISVLDSQNGCLLSQRTLVCGSNSPAASWYSNQRWVMAAGEAGLSVWNGADGKPVCEVPAPKGRFHYDQAPRGGRLAVGGRDRMLTLWSLRGR
jgi:WD40 repeat protein